MYNAPPQYQSTGPTGVPQTGIDWGVIGESFKLLFAHWQTYCLAGAAVVAAMLPLGLVWLLVFVFQPQTPESVATSLALMFSVMGIVGLLVIALTGVIAAGIVNFTLKVSRNIPASTADLWIGFKNPLPYAAAVLIEVFASTLGFCACIIGTIFVTGLLMFNFPIMVDQRIGAWEATKRSWEMLKADWPMAGLFMFVLQLISQLGSYACYIGIVLTLPYLYIAPVLLYNRYMGYGAQVPYNPASPYPRGQQTGSGIGEQPPPQQP
jgi:hypothetical protein